jgi:hypothetical protein
MSDVYCMMALMTVMSVVSDVHDGLDYCGTHDGINTTMSVHNVLAGPVDSACIQLLGTVCKYPKKDFRINLIWVNIEISRLHPTWFLTGLKSWTPTYSVVTVPVQDVHCEPVIGNSGELVEWTSTPSSSPRGGTPGAGPI